MTETSDNSPATSSEPVADALWAAKRRTIEAEGISARKLRRARRLAQKHGLNPVDDIDAVLQLRRKGVDPFDNTTVARLKSRMAGITAKRIPDSLGELGSQFNQTHQNLRANLFPKQHLRGQIARQVMKICLFIGLPTMMVGAYYYNVASNFYVSEARFSIQSTPASVTANGGPDPMDAVHIRDVLTSKQAMLHLDRQHDFIAVFQDKKIDPLHRLGAGISNDEAYKTYLRRVNVLLDPSQGVIHLRVAAPSAQSSLHFINGLLELAKQRVAEQTANIRQHQLDAHLAMQNYANTAREKAIDQMLQSFVMSRHYGPPAQAQAIPIMADAIGQLHLDVAARNELLMQSIKNIDSAHKEIAQLGKFMTIAVNPVLPDAPSHPRRLENTLLAFGLFCAIYAIILAALGALGWYKARETQPHKKGIA